MYYFEKKQKKNERMEDKIENNAKNSKNSSYNMIRNIEEPVVVTEKPQKNNNPPPLTRTDVELKVFVLKVVELKKELKARGQDTSGLKKDLRNRLINAMLEDMQREQLEYVSTQNNLHLTSVIVEESLEEKKEGPDKKDILKGSKEKDGIEEEKTAPRSLPTEKEEVIRQSLGKESTSSMQVEHNYELNQQSNKSGKEKFTNLVHSEDSQEREHSKQTSIHKRPLKNQESSLAAIREVNIVPSHISDGCNKSQPQSDEEKSELTEIKVKTFSQVKKVSDGKEDVTRPPSEVSCTSKTSSNSVKDMVSKFSGFSSSLSSSNSGSALSKGLQAKKEARQAKIAEMRAKVR